MEGITMSHPVAGWHAACLIAAVSCSSKCMTCLHTSHGAAQPQNPTGTATEDYCLVSPHLCLAAYSIILPSWISWTTNTYMEEQLSMEPVHAQMLFPTQQQIMVAAIHKSSSQRQVHSDS